MMSGQDTQWFEAIENVVNPPLTAANDFIDTCLQSGIPKGYIRWNATAQQAITPNIITLAAVLDAVPLEDGHPSMSASHMVFDSLTEWAGFDALDATHFMYDNYVNVTTSMAKMNPGLDVHGPNKINPKLTKRPQIAFTDYVVKEKLFAFFLNYGCDPLTREHRLVEHIQGNNPWPKPITVYGYDDTLAIAGDLYEAETNCDRGHRNSGHVATQVNNLAYFSRKPSISEPLLQPTADTLTAPFNSSKTYVSIIVGDGDNVDFIKGSRSKWMTDRVNSCEADPSGCFPLAWTISPALLHLAPDWLRWFYEQAFKTNHDYFVLPPSGHTYSYPSMMHTADQEEYVRLTEEDARLLNTSGTVTWEFLGFWYHALHKFLPRYSEKGVIRGVFPVNVPYMVPIMEFGFEEQFKVLGHDKNVVVFRPNEWRGAKDCGFFDEICNTFFKSATKMSEHINGYKKGTVAAFYTTSDGGMNMQLIYDTAKLLGEHVEIVNTEVLVDMALQKHNKHSSVDSVII